MRLDAVESGKHRIQLDITARQREALARVQQKIDCNSFAEVFRRALIIMEKIVEREEGGEHQFGFVNKDNEFREVWFI